MPKNAVDLGKLIVAKGFKKLPKVQKIAQSGHTGHNIINREAHTLVSYLFIISYTKFSGRGFESTFCPTFGFKIKLTRCHYELSFITSSTGRRLVTSRFMSSMSVILKAKKHLNFD